MWAPIAESGVLSYTQYTRFYTNTTHKRKDPAARAATAAHPHPRSGIAMHDRMTARRSQYGFTL